MDNNRIKPVSPSVARLKYPANKQNQQQKKKLKNNEQKPSAENGNVIDDFA